MRRIWLTACALLCVLALSAAAHEDEAEEEAREERLKTMHVSAGSGDLESGALSTVRIAGRDCVGPILGATGATALALVSAQCLGDAVDLKAALPGTKELAPVLKVQRSPDQRLALVLVGAGLPDQATPLFILKPDARTLSEMKHRAMNLVVAARNGGVTGVVVRGTAGKGEIALEGGCPAKRLGAPVVLTLKPQHYVAAVVTRAGASCRAALLGADPAVLDWLRDASTLADIKMCERQPDNHIRCEFLRR